MMYMKLHLKIMFTDLNGCTFLLASVFHCYLILHVHVYFFFSNIQKFKYL